MEACRELGVLCYFSFVLQRNDFDVRNLKFIKFVLICPKIFAVFQTHFIANVILRVNRIAEYVRIQGSREIKAAPEKCMPRKKDQNMHDQ